MTPAASVTQGRYNLGFSPTTGDSTELALPQGSGFGTLTIGATGTATWVAAGYKDANGVVLTVVSGLAAMGRRPCTNRSTPSAPARATAGPTTSGSRLITEQSFDRCERSTNPATAPRAATRPASPCTTWKLMAVKM